MTKMLRDEIPLNPHVAGLPPYNAGMNIAAAQKHSGRQDIAALASNENPDGCSPKVAAALAGLNPARYCDPACTALRTALSRKLDVPADRIVVGNGSEEMIAAVCRAILRPEAFVATLCPGFGLHEIEALANGARVEKVAMRADLDFDIPAIMAMLAQKPAIFFLLAVQSRRAGTRPRRPRAHSLGGSATNVARAGRGLFRVHRR